MSYQASTAVTLHSRHSGTDLLVMLMLANHAHSDGTNAFPSIPTLARECRMSDRGIQYIIARLVESGELQQTGTMPSGTRIYRINLPISMPPCRDNTPVKNLHPPGANCSPPLVQTVHPNKVGSNQSVKNQPPSLKVSPLEAVGSSSVKRTPQTQTQPQPDKPATPPPFLATEDPHQLICVDETCTVAAWKLRYAYRIGDAAFFGDGTPWVNPLGATFERLRNVTTHERAGVPNFLP